LYHWYVPTDVALFNLSLGVQFPVYGWVTAVSIYGRILLVVLLLRKWWMEPWTTAPELPR
jgi:hypothetical protein